MQGVVLSEGEDELQNGVAVDTGLSTRMLSSTIIKEGSNYIEEVVEGGAHPNGRIPLLHLQPRETKRSSIRAKETF